MEGDCGLLNLLRSGELDCLSQQLRSLESDLKKERDLNTYRNQIITSLLKGHPIPKPDESLHGAPELYETVSRDYERQTSIENFSLDQFITSIYHSIASATENNKYTYQKIFEQYYERRLETKLEDGVPVEKEIYRPKTIQVELENGKINVPLVSIFPHELPRLNEFSADFETSLSSLQSSKIVRDYHNRSYLEELLCQNHLGNHTWRQFLTIYRACTLQLPVSKNSDTGAGYLELGKRRISVRKVEQGELRSGNYLLTKGALEYLVGLNQNQVQLWNQSHLIDELGDLEGLVPVVFAIENSFLVVVYFQKSGIIEDAVVRLEELFTQVISSYVNEPRVVCKQFDWIYETFKKWANLYLIDLDSNDTTMSQLLSQINSNRDGLSLQMKINQPKPELRTVKMNLKFTYSDNNNGLERVNDILANQIIVT